jgi:homospermidine synthase
MQWMIANPRAGVIFPEDLPHDEMINSARPFLGEIYSAPVVFFPQSINFEDYIIFIPGTPANRLLH